jgi:23S rRNA (cytidine1920-2'-O)/16S rRNA (cytidine1409-2'-O)-methyltransferase
VRADLFLVRQGFAASRAEAQAAIAAGLVIVDGQVVAKPSQLLTANSQIAFEKVHPHVSRGALKLAAGLDRFALSPRDKTCLDIGASTGGFTEILLRRGAARVYAVDVGHGQMHESIARHPRVISLEGVNARNLNGEHLPEPVDAIVADVSFISLQLALPNALAMVRPDAWLVALVKPQFEVGRDGVGKGGIVRDSAAREGAVNAFTHWISSVQGWSVLGVMESPIEGGDGNREFLVAARKP